MDGSVGQRLGERRVDPRCCSTSVRPSSDGAVTTHLEVVAAAGPVDHVELRRIRKRGREQLLQRRAHPGDRSRGARGSAVAATAVGTGNVRARRGYTDASARMWRNW